MRHVRLTMKKTPGIRRKGRRWEAYIRVSGILHTTTFPLDTPIAVMQVWREQQRGERLTRGSFAADVAAYLKTVAHMPTLEERTFHLQWWIAQLGAERSRYTITTTDIDQALSALRASGKAATTVRHYRTALLHLFNRLDGRDARNPVRSSWKPKDPPPEARAIPPGTLRAILKAIKGPKTKARLWVMATTGLPQKQLMQLTPNAIDWALSRVRVPARRKGAGVAGRYVPLNRSARWAFRSLDKHHAWGPFSIGGMRKVWQRALTRLGLPLTLRPYDVRHTVGTELYRITGDLSTVARVLGHADVRTTARYSLDAHARADASAMAKVRFGLDDRLEGRTKRQSRP